MAAERWDRYFLFLAKQVATGSRCYKRQVGSVLVDKNLRVIATGFNGRPRNTDCDNEECIRKDIPSGTQMHISCCVHSEENALLFADFSASQGSTLYCTHAPCEMCSPKILQMGISKIVFFRDERKNGVDYILRMTHNSHRVRLLEYDLEGDIFSEITHDSRNLS